MARDPARYTVIDVNAAQAIQALGHLREYDIAKLAADIRDLIRERGAGSALLAGHDWGSCRPSSSDICPPVSYRGP